MIADNPITPPTDAPTIPPVPIEEGCDGRQPRDEAQAEFALVPVEEDWMLLLLAKCVAAGFTAGGVPIPVG